MTVKALNVLIQADQKSTHNFILPTYSESSSSSGIKGRVYNVLNQPLQGVLVVAVRSDNLETKIAYTDSNGDYNIPLTVSSDTYYNLTASLSNYNVQRVQNVKVSPNKYSIVNFSLTQITNPIFTGGTGRVLDYVNPNFVVLYPGTSINQREMAYVLMSEDDFSAPINLLDYKDSSPVFRVKVLSLTYPLSEEDGQPTNKVILKVKKPVGYSEGKYIWGDVTEEDVSVVLTSYSLYEHNYLVFVKPTFDYIDNGGVKGIILDRVYRLGFSAKNMLWYTDNSQGIKEIKMAFMTLSGDLTRFSVKYVFPESTKG